MDELYYYAFCIGYDFMNNFFKNCEIPECDIVFEECKRLAKEFMNSTEYKDTNLSSYEQLENWIEKNKDTIKNNYLTTEEIDKLSYITEQEGNIKNNKLKKKEREAR